MKARQLILQQCAMSLATARGPEDDDLEALVLQLLQLGRDALVVEHPVVCILRHLQCALLQSQGAILQTALN